MTTTMQATRDRIDCGEEIRLVSAELELIATYRRAPNNWLLTEQHRCGEPAGPSWLLQDRQLAEEVERRISHGWLPEY